MSPIFRPDDPDFLDMVPKKVVVPPLWERRLERACKELRCSRRPLIVQMLRASMQVSEKGPEWRAPIPEGPELVGKDQDNEWLAPFRWELIDAEAKARGLSRNKVFQAHFLRGLEMAEEQAEQEKKHRK